jgi:carbamate kinase
MMDSRFAVLAIGGNSLIKDKNHIALSWQYEAVQETSKYIADLIGEGLSIVITHGNGPQVGFIYRRGELARHEPESARHVVNVITGKDAYTDNSR